MSATIERTTRMPLLAYPAFPAVFRSGNQASGSFGDSPRLRLRAKRFLCPAVLRREPIGQIVEEGLGAKRRAGFSLRLVRSVG